MNHLTKLFQLLELTRSQPQYGYALAGIPKDELSDLAQHHYLVTMIAWTLAREVKRAGAEISVERVLEFALLHDLGELFGGDIAMPYARVNPKARKLAKAFEGENQRYLAKFFAPDASYIRALAKEILNARSDEALIAKVADYIEVVHYRQYVGRVSPSDIAMSAKAMDKKIAKAKDQQVRKTLGEFAKLWRKEMLKPRKEIFEDNK
ncbi:MAG: hypothetical protein A2722_03435 [Candidatus Doudnabacteria bacterium RIFCSPHIGHO2_01_FULL_50_11]|uniref:HD domain-containing protein n=1 Tax=Candidatus Doudnabacteria bacterium RIFCSPHIGHO2_01_FULL_50_11 TaxID=1817828 RepID=A0A1F5PIE9_9BACT|nr:MAG: hypothetical protein A2722_03435 [Candidatus Doudnabacteria bacterium RIFCSPHIGHO2_01_FULL_50_11]HLC44285.1 HD domain-containing protein [Patescibacteria group bacterium]